MWKMFIKIIDEIINSGSNLRTFGGIKTNLYLKFEMHFNSIWYVYNFFLFLSREDLIKYKSYFEIMASDTGRFASVLFTTSSFGGCSPKKKSLKDFRKNRSLSHFTIVSLVGCSETIHYKL